MYSCLYPSRFRSENAASKRLQTRPEAGSELPKRDCFASLAKSGDFPFRAISRITLEEKSREIASSCSTAKSFTFFCIVNDIDRELGRILDYLARSSYNKFVEAPYVSPLRVQ